MMKVLTELLTRLVVALEIIAANSGQATAPQPSSPGLDRSEVDTTMGLQRDYADTAKRAGGREALLLLCEKRGIEVPPRTKTDTLVKKLNSWDLANPSGVEEQSQGTENSGQQQEKEEDAFGATDDADPFAEQEEKTYTKTDVITEFQAYMSANYADDQAGGNAFARDIFVKHGGAPKLGDVDPASYPAIIKALEAAK